MSSLNVKRRQALKTMQACIVVAPSFAWAQTTASNDVHEAQARAFERNIREVLGNKPMQTARVTLDIAPLIDNGNTIPIEVRVDSPMTSSDFVQSITVINERNPMPDVARFTLTPAMGQARVATRIRLATSQRLIAIAQMNDGSFWSHTVEVVVTLAACIED